MTASGSLSLNWRAGRIGIGSMALGIGLAAMDYAAKYAKEQIQFDKTLASPQESNG